jgi:hypothetical protein
VTRSVGDGDLTPDVERRPTIFLAGWMRRDGYAGEKAMSMRSPIIVVICGLLAGAAQVGCTQKSAPPLVTPAHVFAACGTKQARLTAILSVISSTDDIVHADDVQTDKSVHTLIVKTGGVIGYWNDQLLLLPRTAHALGESGDYVHVQAAAITAVPDGLAKHRVYLKVSDLGNPHWIALDAYDVQNPCVEGHISM